MIRAAEKICVGKRHEQHPPPHSPPQQLLSQSSPLPASPLQHSCSVATSIADNTTDRNLHPREEKLPSNTLYEKLNDSHQSQSSISIEEFIFREHLSSKSSQLYAEELNSCSEHSPLDAFSPFFLYIDSHILLLPDSASPVTLISSVSLGYSEEVGEGEQQYTNKTLACLGDICSRRVSRVWLYSGKQGFLNLFLWLCLLLKFQRCIWGNLCAVCSVFTHAHLIINVQCELCDFSCLWSVFKLYHWGYPDVNCILYASFDLQ